jgi:4'-phosphopantetheinyl transferase
MEPPFLPLAAGEVRVYLALLSGETPHPEDHSLLDLAERARAARLIRPADGFRYVQAHARMRRILGGLLGLPAAGLEFALGDRGKPLLPDHPHLHFNLSHSGSLMALAVTEAGPVGVDVERIDTTHRLDDLVDRYFAPAEGEAFLALPPERRPEAFFEIWTRKEAFIKVTGEGLSRGLGSFEVTVGKEAGLERVDGAPPGDRWWVRDVAVPTGYRGAVVVEGRVSSFQVVGPEGGVGGVKGGVNGGVGGGRPGAGG